MRLGASPLFKVFNSHVRGLDDLDRFVVERLAVNGHAREQDILAALQADRGRFAVGMIVDAEILNADVLGVGDLNGKRAFFAEKIAQREVFVASRAVCGANDVLAADGFDILDHDIRVWRARLTVVLNVDGVHRVLCVDIADGDIVGAVADFDRAAVETAFEPNIADSDIADAEAVVAAGYRDDVPTHAKGFEVADLAANDVAALIPFRRRDIDAVFGTVVKSATCDSELAGLKPEERSALALRNGIVVAMKLAVLDGDALGLNDE